MKKVLLILACIALTLTIPSCSKNAKYKAVVEQMNKQLPMDLGELTMDKAEVDGDNFKYYYTFKGEPAMTAEDLANSTKAALVTMVKGNAEMKIFRDDNMVICFIYNKSDGTVFTEIKVTPEEYK